MARVTDGRRASAGWGARLKGALIDANQGPDDLPRQFDTSLTTAEIVGILSEVFNFIQTSPGGRLTSAG
jgi:hypothetical protein